MLLRLQKGLKSQQSALGRCAQSTPLPCHTPGRGMLTSLVIRSLKESTCGRDKAVVRNRSQKEKKENEGLM